MSERQARGLVVMGTGAVLAFSVIWAAVVGSPAFAIFGCVLLVVLSSVMVIAPAQRRRPGGGIDASMELRQRERIEEVIKAGLDGSGVVGEPTSSGDRGIGSTITKDALRRFAEDLITESAEWGWMMGQLGSTTVPRPVVEWIGDQPRITVVQAIPADLVVEGASGTERPGYDLAEDR